MPRRCCPGSSGPTTRPTRSASRPEHRTRLEAILAALPAELFRADDALGWVYQFWQTKRKKEVNDSGRKIGGADLPPVTQLFTEHYMVRFLLENSLGAWWAGRHPESPLLREWEYLRFRDDGTPAAGTFEGWPERAAEVTVMDPCMGSGHFLVAAADMLRKMRMEEEGLTASQAAAAVLRDNLFGLELDPRCTQLGAFALAFDAWKAGGYQQLPVPNIACSGIAVKGQLDDWRRLAGDDANMAAALERLYALFQDAPELGSLIDPTAAAGDGLWRVDPAELQAKLETALAKERNDPAAAVFGAAAEGTAKAARLLSGRYWLVATNPPFLRFPSTSSTGRRWRPSSTPTACPSRTATIRPSGCSRGRSRGSTAPLQVAVARLLGYRWPDQEPDDLDELADDDGIVPLPSVRAETPAAERLRALLARAYGSAWSPALLDQLLAEAGSPGATLESWLRDDFFAQHARLFGNRPFIWQVWDGRKDGFSVLLNYHRLDGPALEKLTYTYLNDWIERQKAAGEEPAAEARLVAALELQGKLKQILDGEPPFDIYVRWKSLAEQPIGWQPDLDDGVRLNIRPFVWPASSGPSSRSTGTRTAAPTPTAASASTIATTPGPRSSRRGRGVRDRRDLPRRARRCPRRGAPRDGRRRADSSRGASVAR